MSRRSKQVLVPVDRHLADCIRVRRESCSMSASALDRQAGLRPGSVSKLERGEKGLKPVQLLALAEVLGMSVDTFFEGAPEISPSVDLLAGRDVPASEAAELVRAFVAIPSAGSRREFVALVRSVADSEAFGQRPVGKSGKVTA